MASAKSGQKFGRSQIRPDFWKKWRDSGFAEAKIRYKPRERTNKLMQSHYHTVGNNELILTS